MKVCVFSDSHGHITPLKAYLKELEGVVDAFWFLGDYTKDAHALRRSLSKPFVIVKGNCDIHAIEPENCILEHEGKRILLTHGHQYNVKNTLTTIFLKAQAEAVDLVCFGHTHMALKVTEGDIVLFNPGSPTSPRGHRNGSVGFIEIESGQIKCEHLWL